MKRLKRSFSLAFILFAFFLVARFGGLSYYPDLRYINLLIISAPILFTFFSGLSFRSGAWDTFLVSFTAYTVYAVLFYLYLFTDPHYSEFLFQYDIYGGELDKLSLAFITIFEGLMFSLIASLLHYLMYVQVQNKKYSQSEKAVSRSQEP